MASSIHLQFEDKPHGLAKYSVSKEGVQDQVNEFITKYKTIIPDLPERFVYREDDYELNYSGELELHFIIGTEYEYDSSDDNEKSKLLLSFFESNLDISRKTNSLDRAFDRQFYNDLHNLMVDKDGKVYWLHGSSTKCINFTGDFVFEADVYLTKDGLQWEVY